MPGGEAGDPADGEEEQDEPPRPRLSNAPKPCGAANERPPDSPPAGQGEAGAVSRDWWAVRRYDIRNRFIEDRGRAAFLDADVVALPYVEASQSGVLNIAAPSAARSSRLTTASSAPSRPGSLSPPGVRVRANALRAEGPNTAAVGAAATTLSQHRRRPPALCPRT